MLLRSASSIMLRMSSSVILESPILLRTSLRLSKVMSCWFGPCRMEKLCLISSSAVMVDIILNGGGSTVP